MAAQQDPEKYRNLIVRIAGYSAYFVDLSPHSQADHRANGREHGVSESLAADPSGLQPALMQQRG